MRVVEVDPSVADLVVLDFYDRATVIAGLASGGRNVGQRAQVGAARAPADDHMAVASGKDLLDIQMKALTGAVLHSRGKNVGLQPRSSYCRTVPWLGDSPN